MAASILCTCKNGRSSLEKAISDFVAKTPQTEAANKAQQLKVNSYRSDFLCTFINYGPRPAPPSPGPLRFGFVGCVGWFRKSFKLLGFPIQATFEKLPKKK